MRFTRSLQVTLEENLIYSRFFSKYETDLFHCSIVPSCFALFGPNQYFFFIWDQNSSMNTDYIPFVFHLVYIFKKCRFFFLANGILILLSDCVQACISVTQKWYVSLIYFSNPEIYVDICIITLLSGLIQKNFRWDVFESLLSLTHITAFLIVLFV